MTKKIEVEFTCPDCQYAGKTEVYQSVNVTLEPELKEKVLNFELFLMICPKCQARLDRLTHLLYHDMDRHLMIWLHPLEERLHWQEYVEKDIQGFQQSVEMMGGKEIKNIPTLRTCFGPLELREKILIFDADLDDKVIELMKLRFLAQHREEFIENIPGVYFVEREDNGDAVLMVFDEHKGENLGQLRVPQDLLSEDQSELMESEEIVFVLNEPYVSVRKLFESPPVENGPPPA
ncbi:MAG: CpXC domain-containing protein [Alphaproteobacteria bacterium]